MPQDDEDKEANGDNEDNGRSLFHRRLDQFRQLVLSLEHKMQAEYDKSVLMLSGGSLGLSFAFLKDLIGKQALNSPGWLLSAWICWGVSATFTLASFYTSARAMRKAVVQTDQQDIYVQRAGGWFDKATSIFNAAAGLLFLLGLVSIVVFVTHNLMNYGK
jgi:hypothetical protein